MRAPGSEPPTAKPSAAGCVLGALAMGALVFAVAFVVIFLESGADSGAIVLRDQRAYARGTATHVTEHGFFLVRLGGDLLALSDLDAANRTASGQRCRVHTIEPGTAAADDLLGRFAGRVSPAAVGTVLLLGEDCNGAVYDIAGVRLDGDGPNLDRLGVALDDRGRVVVTPQERTCSERVGGDYALPRDC